MVRGSSLFSSRSCSNSSNSAAASSASRPLFTSSEIWSSRPASWRRPCRSTSILAYSATCEPETQLPTALVRYVPPPRA